MDIEPLPRIVAKTIKKANPGIASELILYLRSTTIALVKARKGKELVQVYLEKGSEIDREFVILLLLEKLNETIVSEDIQYLAFNPLGTYSIRLWILICRALWTGF